MGNNVKNFKLFLESLEGDVQSRLCDIFEKMKECTTSGWKGEELQESISCVALEDANLNMEDVDNDDPVTYNGWYEELVELSSENEEVKELVDLMEECKEDLWEHNLENTFSCFVTEGFDLSEEEDGYSLEYNDWIEKFEELCEK